MSIKAFIIGSSLPIVLPFYLVVAGIKHKKYSYESYSIIAPLYFGLLNVILHLVKPFVKMHLLYLYLLFGFCSALFVFMIAWTQKLYPFVGNEWLTYFSRLLLKHLFAFLTMYFIEISYR